MQRIIDFIDILQKYSIITDDELLQIYNELQTQDGPTLVSNFEVVIEFIRGATNRYGVEVPIPIVTEVVDKIITDVIKIKGAKRGFIKGVVKCRVKINANHIPALITDVTRQIIDI